MSRVVFYFHLPSLQLASQKSCDDCLFLNKCSTEKLCLLADVMLVSMIILRIMVSKKKGCFQHWKSILIMQYFSCHSVLNYTTPHDDQNTKWLNFSKCSPINLIFSLFNFLAKNKLLPVNRKYLLINQTYMNGLETILCNQSLSIDNWQM